jgi:hypothetical protein
MKRSRAIGLGALEALVAVAWVVQARLRADLALAAAHAAQGSRVLETRLGPIEVQQAGPAPLVGSDGSERGGSGPPPAKPNARA